MAALRDFDYARAFIEEVNIAKKYFKKEVKQYFSKIHGDGGNFILVGLDASIKKDLIAHMEMSGIYTRDYGHVKGMEDFMRITIGTKNQMKRVVEEIKKFFEK